MDDPQDERLSAYQATSEMVVVGLTCSRNPSQRQPLQKPLQSATSKEAPELYF